MDHAITGNMANLLAVVKAAKRFRKVVSERRGRLMEGIFGSSKMVAPPHSLRSKSHDEHDRHPLDQILVTAGVHRDYDDTDGPEKVASDLDELTMVQSPETDTSGNFERGWEESSARYKQRMESTRHHSARDHGSGGAPRSSTFPFDHHESLNNAHGKGHAHDPLEDHTFLAIGQDPEVPENRGTLDYPIVSESPPAVEMNIYEQAYQDEMEKILERRGREPSMYLTRRVEHREDLRALSNIKDAGKNAMRTAAAKFEDLSSRGYARGQEAGDAGRLAARSAAGKVSERLSRPSTATSEYLEPWKQSAKDTASWGYEKLGDLYNKSGSSSGSGGISGLVSRAQAKVRGDGPETAQPASEQGDRASQQPVSTNPPYHEATTQPFAEASEKPADTTSPSQSVPGSSTETKATPASTPAAVVSAFKEHIT